jgi:hypothetical protein
MGCIGDMVAMPPPSRITSKHAQSTDDRSALHSLRLLSNGGMLASRFERWRCCFVQFTLLLLRPRLRDGYMRITWTCVGLLFTRSLCEYANLVSEFLMMGMWREHVCRCKGTRSKSWKETAGATTNILCSCRCWTNIGPTTLRTRF